MATPTEYGIPSKILITRILFFENCRANASDNTRAPAGCKISRIWLEKKRKKSSRYDAVYGTERIFRKCANVLNTVFNNWYKLTSKGRLLGCRFTCIRSDVNVSGTMNTKMELERYSRRRSYPLLAALKTPLLKGSMIRRWLIIRRFHMRNFVNFG